MDAGPINLEVGPKRTRTENVFFGFRDDDMIRAAEEMRLEWKQAAKTKEAGDIHRVIAGLQFAKRMVELVHAERQKRYARLSAVDQAKYQDPSSIKNPSTGQSITLEMGQLPSSINNTFELATKTLGMLANQLAANADGF
jgi:hypothetical protein